MSTAKSSVVWYILLVVAIVVCLVIPLTLLAILAYQEEFDTLWASNQAPLAVFTISPPGGTNKTVFHFDASASEDKEDARERLQLRWNFGDTHEPTRWNSQRRTTHRYAKAGIKEVVLEVKDSQGEISKASQRLSVEKAVVNTPPHAVIEHRRDSGQFLQFEFLALNCRDQEDKVEDLQVRWDFDGDGNWDSDYSKNKRIQYTFARCQSYKVKLQVKDSGGLTNEAEVTIHNYVPEIMYLTHEKVSRNAKECSQCHYPLASEAPCSYAQINPVCTNCHRFQEKP